MNTGSTVGSVNFPNVQLPRLANAHRLLHVHQNVPGILAAINAIFAKRHINVVGQYLKTNELVGYVITDVARNYDPVVIRDLKDVPSTIKFRVLYLTVLAGTCPRRRASFAWLARRSPTGSRSEGEGWWTRGESNP